MVARGYSFKQINKLMNIYKFINLLLFSHLIFPLFSQNYISISSTKKELDIQYFPPLKTFANPFYLTSLVHTNEGGYVLKLDSIFHKEVRFIIEDVEISVFVGIRDTVNIFFNASNGQYSFSGNNAIANKIYNLELSNRIKYKKIFEDFFLKNSATDWQEGIFSLFKNEIIQLDKMYSINENSTSCIKVYKTSTIISMLFWIRRTCNSENDFKNILPELLSIANLSEDDIRNCSRNHTFYITYYATNFSKGAQETSNFLLGIGYILNAPEDIKDFMLQSEYIGRTRFIIDPSYNWCSIFEEVKKYSTEIYFKDFFNAHKPCK